MSEEHPPGEPEDLFELEPLPRADDFSSDFATRFSVGYSDGRVFFIDFRVPDVRALPVERQDSGGGSMSGQPVSVSQVQLPPNVAKELHAVLEQELAEYEREFGEIETE